MSAESYRKAGRGGAGNYFGPKDTEESNGAAHNVLLSNVTWKLPRLLTFYQDIEAQTLTTPVESNIIGRSPSEYAYLGRGGAGNLYSPQEIQQTVSVTSAAPITTKSAPLAQTAFFGRGGAGNYNSDDSDGKIQQQNAAAARRHREEEVATEVEKELRPPERAYLSPERADASI